MYISGSLLGIFFVHIFFFPHRQYVGIPEPGIEPMLQSSNQSHSGKKAGASTH